MRNKYNSCMQLEQLSLSSMGEKTTYAGIGTGGHGNWYPYFPGFRKNPLFQMTYVTRFVQPSTNVITLLHLLDTYEYEVSRFMWLIHHEIHIIRITVNDEPFNRCRLLVHCVGFGLRTCARPC